MSQYINEFELIYFIINNEKYKPICINTSDYPKAYYTDIKSVRAIVIGADPGNIKKEEFQYVFELESGTQSDYFRKILKNIELIGLSLEDLYVQNLCKNYFKEVTSDNDIWSEVAELWIPLLKKELDSFFDSSIPVFITAGKIRDVLCLSVKKNKDYKRNYQDATFIDSKDNKLNRTLIPLYRPNNDYYCLMNWKPYTEKIKALFNNG
jgi:hypothetical protein